MLSKQKQAKNKKPKSTLKRLLIANLLAAALLLTVTVTVLLALGLLDTVFAFIFFVSSLNSIFPFFCIK